MLVGDSKGIFVGTFSDWSEAALLWLTCGAAGLEINIYALLGQVHTVLLQ